MLLSAPLGFVTLISARGGSHNIEPPLVKTIPVNSKVYRAIGVTPKKGGMTASIQQNIKLSNLLMTLAVSPNPSYPPNSAFLAP